MKRLQITCLLLALTVLGGQWLAIAHSAEHTAYQAEDALCALCVQTHNLEQAQLDAVPRIDTDSIVLAPAPPAALQTAESHIRHGNIRAPPILA